jgi:hypothetical protein
MNLGIDDGRLVDKMLTSFEMAFLKYSTLRIYNKNFVRWEIFRYQIEVNHEWSPNQDLHTWNTHG